VRLQLTTQPSRTGWPLRSVDASALLTTVTTGGAPPTHSSASWTKSTGEAGEAAGAGEVD